MPDSVGRRHAVLVAVLAATLLVSILPSVTNSATPPPGLERFLYALGQVESGGNYYARNSTSGAYGKYQIMPASWRAWAGIYLGNSAAPQTPANQEIVAHRKVTALYWWLDTWPTVAHWWLSGSSERNPAYWSSFSRMYVNRIMAVMAGASDPQGAPAPPAPLPTGVVTTRTIHLSDSSSQIAYRAPWSTARFSGYEANLVHYATRDGATATVSFDGKSITWIGPVGPTRGKARVVIDGRAVTTVDLRRTTFRARATLFSQSWPTTGRHTLRIEVVGSGRPVAIDELVITRG